MTTMAEWFGSGRIVDVLLILVMLEIAVIGVVRHRTGAGVATLPLLINVGSGASLMLALRLALVDAAWHWMGACLLAALAFHVADLAQRWSAPK